jgi:hypothetical protein
LACSIGDPRRSSSRLGLRAAAAGSRRVDPDDGPARRERMTSPRAIGTLAALAIVLLLASGPASAQNAQQRRVVTIEVNTGRYSSDQDAINEATRLVREWEGTQLPVPGWQIVAFGYQVKTTQHKSWHHYIPIGIGGSVPGALWGTTEYSVEKVTVTIYEIRNP